MFLQSRKIINDFNTVSNSFHSDNPSARLKVQFSFIDKILYMNVSDDEWWMNVYDEPSREGVAFPN